MAVMFLFFVYYVRAVMQYGRWLRDNYADLEHKEVWQSLLFIVALFVIYEAYFTNPGVMSREYLAQVNTIVIVGFLLWRVENLQRLDDSEKCADEAASEDQLVDDQPVSDDDPDATETASKNSFLTLTIPTNIGVLLSKHCEGAKLYLQHDLTLAQLSERIGTNRTYLSSYLAQQGITYNSYINGLRIDHFEHLFLKAVASGHPFTTKQLAYKCGFSSYSTFATAFKLFKGQSVTAWMKENTPPREEA
jgi:AraC-like DNA-binding protein